jgi:hypothetical protein
MAFEAVTPAATLITLAFAYVLLLLSTSLSFGPSSDSSGRNFLLPLLTLFSAVTISVVANALSVTPTISITDLQLISSAQVRRVDHHTGEKMLQLHDMNWYMLGAPWRTSGE